MQPVLAGGNTSLRAEGLAEVIAVGKSAPYSNIVNRQLGIKQKLNGPADPDPDQILDRCAPHRVFEMKEEIPS